MNSTTTKVLVNLDEDIVSEVAKTNMIFKKVKNKKGKTQRQGKRERK